MQSIIANLGRAKRATLHGRPHLYAPVTMIVPGILNGSNGPIFYSREQIAASAQLWNNMPVTVNHPPNGVLGNPDVLDEYAVGIVLNTKVRSSDGALQGEVWIDIVKCKAVTPEIIDRLEGGTPIEVSTGLKLDQVSKTGYHRNAAYDRVAKNFQPDHLALLDQEGACSLRDGCGVLMNCSAKSDCDCKNCEDKEMIAYVARQIEKNRRNADGYDPRFIDADDMDYLPEHVGAPLVAKEMTFNARRTYGNRLDGPLVPPPMFEPAKVTKNKKCKPALTVNERLRGPLVVPAMNFATAPETDPGTVGDEAEPVPSHTPPKKKKLSVAGGLARTRFALGIAKRSPREVGEAFGDIEPEPMSFAPTSFADDPPEADDGEEGFPVPAKQGSRAAKGVPLIAPKIDFKKLSGLKPMQARTAPSRNDA